MDKKEKLMKRLIERLENNPKIAKKFEEALESGIVKELEHIPPHQVKLYVANAGSPEKFLQRVVINVAENLLTGIIKAALKKSLITSKKPLVVSTAGGVVLGASSVYGPDLNQMDSLLENTSLDNLLDDDSLYSEASSSLDYALSENAAFDSVMNDDLFCSVADTSAFPDIEFIPDLPDLDFSVPDISGTDFTDISGIDDAAGCFFDFISSLFN